MALNKNKELLVVDDVEVNRVILREIFQEDYTVLEAQNGLEALAIIDDHGENLAAVLLDIVMPVMDGFGVLEALQERDFIKKVPIFLITAECSEEVTLRGFELGVMDVIERPIVAHIVKKRMESIIELCMMRNQLNNQVSLQEKKLVEKAREIQELNNAMISALATAIEFRDCESGEHVKRIQDLTLFLLKKTSFGKGLREQEIEKIATAAIMHDVGKIAIPDYILNKPGKLTTEEFEIMKTHTVRGCDLLDQIPTIHHNSVYRYAYDICRHHHERWDGKGYPDGLKGDEISLWAQIVALADVYDALTSERVYKPPYTHEKAIEMISNGECGTFNPILIQEFRRFSEEIEGLVYPRQGGCRDGGSKKK
ncbi:cyclic di-GMP phosphodiesterase response regulator RpfG [Anaerotignum neopropionicum]|uniref:Stage 0 sporulation protein A homolog n=1 Tax=Anaerotignum neopropionicum TaxID=36847 RepID=A0A136WHY2_9FIRM|nr:HD domain-containing phosphohydrolase [Anaerotignum neopropionicum]KXL54087.1 cyclic di-GMP phosphodiesterase response regulator RpfG [Anaerotignum neopropionicum]